MNVADLTPERCRELVGRLSEKQRRALVTVLPLFGVEAAALALECSVQSVSRYLGQAYAVLGVARLHQAAVIAAKAGIV